MNSQLSPSFQDKTIYRKDIAMKPGMSRDEIEDMNSAMNRVLKAYGCEGGDLMPEEILESAKDSGREPERRLCGSATQTVWTADHSCMNPEKDSAPTNFASGGVESRNTQKETSLHVGAESGGEVSPWLLHSKSASATAGVAPGPLAELSQNEVTYENRSGKPGLIIGGEVANSPGGKVVWQPIETAPKDGTEIIGLVDGEEYRVRWAETRRCMLAGVAGGSGYFGPGWEDTYNGLISETPTHWREFDSERVAVTEPCASENFPTPLQTTRRTDESAGRETTPEARAPRYLEEVTV